MEVGMRSTMKDPHTRAGFSVSQTFQRTELRPQRAGVARPARSAFGLA